MKTIGRYYMALLFIAAACNSPEKKFESLDTTNSSSIVAGPTPGYTNDVEGRMSLFWALAKLAPKQSISAAIV